MAKRSFKELTQHMSFSEKCEYLWEYYKWVLVVAAFAAMVIAMVVTGIVNGSVDILYSGAAVNVQISEQGQNSLTEEWAEKLGAGKNQKADLFLTAFEDLSATSDVEISSAAAMQVVLMITAGDYDYVIMDEVALNFYKNHPVFAALDTVFSEETMDAYRDKIFYQETEEAGRFPFAIDISDSAFVREYINVETKVYIAFPGNTGRTELNDAFLTYLMNMN